MARGEFFRNLTPEQMAEFQKHRVEKIKANPNEKRDVIIFASDTEEYWRERARQENIRLPRPNTPLTTGNMTAWLRKAGIPRAKFCSWVGLRLQTFINYNPKLSLRAACGTALEHKDQILAS